MTTDERSRHALYLRLEEVLGSDEAGTLMEHLPPVGWADVATRRDLTTEIAHLRTDMNAELASARSEMATEFASVRSEMATEFASVRSEMATEFASVRSDVKALAADCAGIRIEMRAMEQSLIGLFRMELAQAISTQTRTLVVTMITLFVAGMTLAFAAARMG